MTALDKILRDYDASNLMGSSFNDYADGYGDFIPLSRPEPKGTPSNMTLLIRNGTITETGHFPFKFRGELYDSLADMCDSNGLDAESIINMVKSGATFSEAVTRAEDFEDCSDLIAKVEQRKQAAIDKARESEERARIANIINRVNDELYTINREVARNEMREHANLLALCRRDFLQIFVMTLHESEGINIRILRDMPKCSVENFAMAIEGFYNRLEAIEGITLSKETLLESYYKAMWCEGIDHSNMTISALAKSNLDRDLCSIMQEREKLIIDKATTFKEYNFLERNSRVFATSIPITAKTLDGWFADMSKHMKMPIDYIKFLEGDGISYDKLYTCQKMYFTVKLKMDTIKCLGIMKVEYFFDIFIDQVIKAIDLDRINVQMPLDITNLVQTMSAKHISAWKTPGTGNNLEMNLYAYYNKVEYDLVGVQYVANEIKKNPAWILEN